MIIRLPADVSEAVFQTLLVVKSVKRVVVIQEGLGRASVPPMRDGLILDRTRKVKYKS